MNQLQFQIIALKDIFPDPNQPRKFYDETAMEELIQSVKESGVIQPVLVREQPDRHNKYTLVCGERRYRASKAAGLKTIPAVIRELSDDEALQLQIVENLQRKDVHPMEEAVAFKSFQETKDWSVEEIAKRVGKTEYYVKQRIKLNSLCELFQKLFFQNKINITDALEVSRLDIEVQSDLFNELVDEDDLNNPSFHLSIEKFQLDKFRGKLERATFDLDDATLFPSMGACSNCQFNSSVLKLFPDQHGATCGSIKCFAEKTKISFERNIEDARMDPSVVLIVTDSNPDKQAKALMTKYEGVLQPGDFTLIEEPDYNEREWYNGDNDTPEEDEADYQRDLEIYRNELAEWKARIETGKYLKAFVIAGHQKGKYTYIQLKGKGKSKISVDATDPNISGAEPSQASTESQIEEIDNEIERVNDRERRSKEIDENKIWEDLKKHFNPSTNTPYLTNELNAIEMIAIATAMESKLNWQSRRDFGKVFQKNINDQGEIVDLNLSTFNQMCRFFMLDVLPPTACYSGFTNNAKLSIQIAEQYFPSVLTDIQNKHASSIEKRISKVDKRIADLLAQKKKLKSSLPKKAKSKK